MIVEFQKVQNLRKNSVRYLGDVRSNTSMTSQIDFNVIE